MIRIYKQGTTPLYELLEEIHPTNTTTYVDTGIFTSSAISFEVLCKCNPNRNIENDRIIACSTGWSDWETMAVDYEGAPCLNCKFLGDTGWTTFPSITADNDVHKMYLSSTEFKFDDTTLHTHSQTQYSSTSAQIRIAHSYIYQAPEQGYYYYYYVKIWDGETLVRHYVPVKRLSDDKYGFYDMVNNTFNPSIGSSDFTGTSKSTPEYIYGITGGELFVNRIMCNGTQINSILCNDQSYWGNVEPTPPVDRNYICGYATQANTTYIQALYINNTSHTITTDANKYWELDLADTPISSLTENIISTNVITSIDFRHAKFANNCDFTNMLVRNNISYLEDIYFDFTNLTDTSLIKGAGAWFRMCAGTRIHGLGTFKWSGEIDTRDNSTINNFYWREFRGSSGITGTLDLRGYDSTSITDQDPNSAQVQIANRYNPATAYGIWNSCFLGQYDTFIIGNLEMHYLNSSNVWTCTTLYCTTQTPPSLNRTGTYGMQCLNYLSKYPNLQHIYVPTGCLSVYQNAPIWSNYASLMSEQDAPDPLTI